MTISDCRYKEGDRADVSSDSKSCVRRVGHCFHHMGAIAQGALQNPSERRNVLLDAWAAQSRKWLS